MDRRFSVWCLIAEDYRKVNIGRFGRVRRVIGAFFSRGFNAMLLYRLGHSVRNQFPWVAYILNRVAQVLYCVDISPSADLGPGIVLVHCFGIVIGSSTRIEGSCVIFHGVTFGDRGSEWVGSNQPDGHPIIGYGCMFGAGAKVLGSVRVGDNCVVGANSVVLNNVPDNSVVAGLPARIVSQRPVMDDSLRPIGGHRIDKPKAPLTFGAKE